MLTRRLPRLIALAALLLTAGCGSRAPVGLADATPLPTPTIAPMFAPLPTATPRPPATPTPLASPTSAVTAGPAAEGTPEAGAAPTPDPADPTAGLVVAPVYRDGLSSGWTITNSLLMDLTRSTTFVAEGEYALQATARNEFSTLSFTVRRDAKERFERERVVGVRIRLTGGEAPIGNEDLAIAVVGSNAQPYWVPDDTSVELEGRVTDDEPLFSETRLVFLGINSAIPAGEWVDVYVWLDELLYDPDYKYVTGFYLKTDGLERFYVDDVALLLAPEP